MLASLLFQRSLLEHCLDQVFLYVFVFFCIVIVFNYKQERSHFHSTTIDNGCKPTRRGATKVWQSQWSMTRDGLG